MDSSSRRTACRGKQVRCRVRYLTPPPLVIINKNMRATVTKIDPPKMSQYQAVFIRIYFKGEDNGWYQTDVVPVYRNYKNWKPVIEGGVGTVVEGLNTKQGFNRTKVDADSPVRVVPQPKKIIIEQTTLL